MFVLVLVAGVGEECEFCNAGADVLACGCTGREACVSHGLCVGEKKFNYYRRVTDQHDSHCQICYLIL